MEILNLENKIEVVSDQVKKYRGLSKADETKRAVKKNWVQFEKWCEKYGFNSFPTTEEIFESYLVFLADSGLSVSSIDQAKWALDTIHKTKGIPAPGNSDRIKTIMSGIRRNLGRRQKQKAALTFDHVKLMSFPKTLIGIRDKAIILLGIAGGFRRSELAQLKVGDIAYKEGNLIVTIRRSKTDQEGRGTEVVIVPSKDINNCPVMSITHWIEKAELKEGYVFRSVSKWGKIGKEFSTVSIWKTVKNAAENIGLDPKEFGGHSLRAGCATYLLDKGVSLNIVARHGRWQRLDTVIKYDRNTTAKALKEIY